MEQQHQPPVEPPPTTPVPNRVLPYILGQYEIKASRAELVVLALVSLVVVGQLARLVWKLWRMGAFITRQQEQEDVRETEKRKVAIVLPFEPMPKSWTAGDALDDFAMLTSGIDGNGEPTFRIRLRRRSSWGGSGRPVHVQVDTNDGGRRKSAGGPLGTIQDGDEDGNEDGEGGSGQNLLSHLGAGSDPEAGHDALVDVGSLGPEPATPTMLPLSSVTEASEINGRRGADDDVTELRPWGQETRLEQAATSEMEKSRSRSPRSPRVLAADQAAMMGALLNAEKDQDVDWKAERPSPVVVGAEVDVPSLTLGFEDPLGVNRLVGLSETDEKNDEGVELEVRDGERRDV